MNQYFDMNDTLPKQMQRHTYEILNRVENTHWWFVGRRSILESILSEMAEEFSSKDLKILDVGCGTGANLQMLSKFGNAEGVDVSEQAIRFCREKGLKVRFGLAEELPFSDESFDIVTALDVIEHLDDDIRGLREMHRVLKAGGRMLIFVPAFMWLWGVQDEVSNHRIRYTRSQIVERVQMAGFQIERATYANITFLLPIFLGRILMRIFKIKPNSENNINISTLNGIFGKLFGAERFWLKFADIPVGVSIIVVARKI